MLFLVTPPVSKPETTCVTDPLQFTIIQWPLGTTGLRWPFYRSNRPIKLTFDMLQLPWTATATDARGCTVTVKKP